MNTNYLLSCVMSGLVIFSLTHPLHAYAYGDGMKGGKNKSGSGMESGGKKSKQMPQKTVPSMEGKDPEVIGAFLPQGANKTAMDKRGFLATGLEPVYPQGFDCPKVTSPFATPFRTDGSKRSARFFKGLHGGMDIAQPKGTPLLAMADGEVILKHEGEADGIGGLGLWLRHAPEETGTGKYVFVEYKHIDKLPELAVGERVKMGQVIAETGNTGTTGGHYSDEGFYHLHMTAYWSDSPAFKFSRVMIPSGGQWLDPIALLRGGPLDSHQAKDLPKQQKQVAIPFLSTDGRAYPENTKLVWPYACRPQ